MVLPRLTEHSNEKKRKVLLNSYGGLPEALVRDFLSAQLAILGQPKKDVRVLDIGCGRGDTVAWLCDDGWNAHGVEVDEAYVACGRPYFSKAGYGERLHVVSNAYPFPDGFFDIVMSNQVLEHVKDLDALAREVSRVSRPGCHGVHIFPAKWRFREPHIKSPIVHWLPKGHARRVALTGLVALGLCDPMLFPERPLRDRAEIFCRYTDEETFYRSAVQVEDTFQQYGMDTDSLSLARAKISDKLPRVPSLALGAGARLFRQVFQVCLLTRKL